MNLTTFRTTIRGLAINRFTFAGISIGGSDNNVVEGCYIGTNLAGTAASPNGTGIVFTGNVGGSVGHRIGGLAAAQRNVISGNTVDGVRIQSATTTTVLIQGNYIGTNATGTAAIPNGFHGVTITGSPGNFVGGLPPGPATCCPATCRTASAFSKQVRPAIRSRATSLD